MSNKPRIALMFTLNDQKDIENYYKYNSSISCKIQEVKEMI